MKFIFIVLELDGAKKRRSSLVCQIMFLSVSFWICGRVSEVFERGEKVNVASCHWSKPGP
jgi:hypothetical protein